MIIVSVVNHFDFLQHLSLASFAAFHPLENNLILVNGFTCQIDGPFHWSEACQSVLELADLYWDLPVDYQQPQNPSI